MRALSWVAIAAWAAFLFYGQKHAAELAAACTTTRVMKVNHHLTEGDLRCDAAVGAPALYSGKYANHEMAEQTTLVPSAVSDAPSLLLEAGEMLFELKKPDGLTLDVDAGTVLELCNETASLTKRARVVAVVCAARGGDGCAFVFGVPSADLKALHVADPVKIQIHPVVVEPAKAETPSTPKPGGRS